MLTLLFMELSATSPVEFCIICKIQFFSHFISPSSFFPPHKAIMVSNRLLSRLISKDDLTGQVLATSPLHVTN